MPQRITKLKLKDYIEHIPDSAAVSVASRTTVGAGFAGVYSWIASINWIGVISILVALAGLFANLYFQRRRDKREHVEHLARMAEITGRCEN